MAAKEPRKRRPRAPANPDEPEPRSSPRENALPSGRVARTARFGGLVAGQSLRWAGTRAANLTRDEERAERAMGERALGVAEELVDALGHMRGAAMKIGQVLSTIDFEAIPEDERERFKQKLGTLRDSAPSVPWPKIRRVIEQDLGGKLADHFEEIDEEAFAAASIGQVHRAVTTGGREVVVKVQYPGVAEAVETDLRNLRVLFPLVRRLAPALDVKALGDELRERVSEELDYELEAQNQRRVARAFRDHPFIVVPRVDTALSSRRVLVSDRLDGRGFEQVKALAEPERDRFGEIVFRFFFSLLHRERFASGDPHPGNYLLLADGSVGFLDFGLMKTVAPATIAAESALGRAIVAGDAAEVKARLAELGYLPDPGDFEAETLLSQLREQGEWAFTPGFRRLTPEYVRVSTEVGASPRSPYFEQMRRLTLPPDALLVRRMEGLVFSVLGELRAGGDWLALGREHWDDGEPSTPLGEADARWRAQRGGRGA